jgi:MFS family permease
LAILRSHWRIGLYAVVLMTAFNFFSHGTQDLYPTFLQVQHGLSPHAVGTIAAIYNVGAILGGIICGSLSGRIGRRRSVIAALLSLPVLPLWAFSESPVLLAIGAFLMPVMVQGAWGVITVHLNELSPDEARGTFPAFVYQLGNLLASANATIQAGIARAVRRELRVGAGVWSPAASLSHRCPDVARRAKGSPSAPLAGDRLPLRGRCGNGIASDQSAKRGGSLLTQGTKNGALDRLGKTLVVIGIGG